MSIEILSAVRDVNFENAWYAATDANHFWMDWRFRELSRSLDTWGLSKNAELRVLEVGGGHGVVRSQLEAVTRWQVDLTDLNMLSLEQCAPSRGRTLYYDIDDRAPLLHNYYDVVVLLDVLEHIEHTLPFLSSLAWHLKPGGILIVNVPALPLFYSAYDDVLGHYRRYTKASLRQEFARTDLACETLRYWGLAMLPLLAARALLMRRRSGDPRERADFARKGMTPPGPLFASMLKSMMRAELGICRDVVLGTSLLCAARKRMA